MDKVTQLFCIIFTILFIFILASCSTTHIKRKDGPPKFYVDESRIPNAVPKPEPLAKYGNMPYYYVFGKRYYTMRSSKNYQAVGTASWYGTQFHHHKTSSGERYNMLSMTAAHKTLPLPTYVEVTNLANRRKIIVKVNDRGPFMSDRLIDLSYVAAKKLDMLGHGTTRVKITAIDPYTYGKPIVLSKNSRHTHPLLHPAHSAQLHEQNQSVFLQVGAFRNKINAEKLRQRLLATLNAPVKIFLPSLTNRLYRVQVGPIKDMASVDRISLRLKGLGINAIH